MGTSAVSGDYLNEYGTDKLLRFGLYAESYCVYDNMTMLQLTDYYLQDDSRTLEPGLIPSLQSNNINLHSNSSVKDVLISLRSLLLTLPTDNNQFHRAAFAGVFICAAITGIVVALRIYARHYLTGGIRKEDWILVVGYTIGLALQICILVQNGTGNGSRHVWTLTYHQVKIHHLYVRMFELLYVLALYVVKVAFLVFYHSLSPNAVFRKSVLMVFWGNTIATTAGFLVLMFQCHPINSWNYFLTARCVDRLTLYYFLGITSALMDLVLVILPMPIVNKLKLNIRDKLLVLGMFSAGLACFAVALIRVTRLNEYSGGVDIPVAQTATGTLSVFEIDLAIIISCLPALKTVITRYLSRILPQRPNQSHDGDDSRGTISSAPSRFSRFSRFSWPDYFPKVHSPVQVPKKRSGNWWSNAMSAYETNNETNTGNEQVEGPDSISLRAIITDDMEIGSHTDIDEYNHSVVDIR